jgi:histidinol phosphatase-like PHP family hydrolase
MLSRFQNITKENIPKIDYHMHTVWTDGENTSLEMYNRAIQEGLNSILFSEHARKTSADWFLKFSDEIRSLPKSSCQALVGVETKVVDFDGAIDSVDQILEVCDLVMASIHRFPGEKDMKKMCSDIDKKEALKIELDLSLAVLENKKVDILGHPFGMSIRRFNIQPTEDDFKQIIKKAAETGIAIEVNSHYHDNPWEIINWCKEFGALISLGSNAHNVNKVGHINRILKGEEFV